MEQEKLDKFYKKFAGRIDRWNENVEEHRQKYALLKALPIKTILYIVKSGPMVLHLLISLMNHKDISGKTKRRVGAALGYFIFPLDALPEAIVGPVGYVDDILVAMLLIDHLLNGENEEEKTIINTLWQGSEGELKTLRGALRGVNIIRHLGRTIRKILP